MRVRVRDPAEDEGSQHDDHYTQKNCVIPVPGREFSEHWVGVPSA